MILAGQTHAKRRAKVAFVLSLLLVSCLVYRQAFAQEPLFVVVNSGHNQDVVTIAFDSSENLMATGSDDRTIKIWDFKTGMELRTISDSVHQVVFDGEGKILAGATDDGVHLWDLSSGGMRKLDPAVRVDSIAFSPDGKFLASTHGHSIEIWNVATNQKVSEFVAEESNNALRALVYSRDGKLLVSAGSSGTVKMWSMPACRLCQKLTAQTKSVDCLAFSHDGALLATGSEDSTVYLWDPKTGKSVHSIGTASDSVASNSDRMQKGGTGSSETTLSFSANDRLLAFSIHRHFPTDNSISVIHLTEARETSLSAPSPVKVVCYSPRSNSLVCGCSDGSIAIWAAGGSTPRMLKARTPAIASIALTGDCKRMASANWSDDTVSAWSLAGPTVKSLTGHSGEVESVAISKDGTQIASGSYDRTVKLWDFQTGKQLRTFKGHQQRVSATLFGAQGKHIYSGSVDGTIKSWDCAAGTEAREFKNHDTAVSDMAISADGKTLVSGDIEGNIRIWNLDTGLEVRSWKGVNSQVNAVAISRDGQLIASGGGDELDFMSTRPEPKSVDVWDLKSKSWQSLIGDFKRYTLNGHTKNVQAVAFSPDGQYLVSGSDDCSMIVWQMKDGTRFKTLLGHTNSIHSMVFSSDGKFLFSASMDGTIRIWRTADWTELGTIVKLNNGSDWIVLDRSRRRFDASPDGLKAIHGSTGMRIVDKKEVVARCYEPGLLTKLLSQK